MMDISNAVSTMVNNIAAQSDPSFRSNQEIMSAVATQIKANSTVQITDATNGVSGLLIKHVAECPMCKHAGQLKDDCKIGMLMLRIVEKTFSLK